MEVKTRIVKTSRGWVPQVFVVYATIGWFKKREVGIWEGWSSSKQQLIETVQSQLLFCVYSSEAQAEVALKEYKGKEKDRLELSEGSRILD